MSPRQFSKIFLNANIQCRLLSFSVKPSLNTGIRLSHFIRSTATVTSHPTVETSDHVPVRPDNKNRSYFHQYFLNNEHKYCIVKTDNINIEETTNFDSLKLLKDYVNCSEIRKMPGGLVQCLKEELSRYGLEEIYKFIILTSTCDSKERREELMMHLTNELLSRKLSLEERLKILFVITERRSDILKHNYFVFKSLSKLCSKIKRLTPQQAVQVMYSMRKIGKAETQKFKYGLQDYFASIIPQLNADELGIFARGFLFSELPLSHKQLCHVFIDRAIEEIENFQELPFLVLCKILSSCLHQKHGNDLLNFQERVAPFVPKLSLSNMIHLAATGTRINCMNSSLWEVLVNSFKKNIDNFNLHQVKSMIVSATAYRIKDDELFDMAVKRFESENDVLQYPECLIVFLYNLSLHKIYPENLLSLILTRKFNYDKLLFMRKKDYCFINCCAEIEMPTNNFDFLDSEARERLFKVFRISDPSDEYIQTRSIYNYSISKILCHNYGDNLVFLTQCLPHFGTGTVMRFDRTLTAQPITEEFRQSKPNYAMKAPKDGHFWIFITIVGKNQFLHDAETPNCKLQTQIRQLEAMGYKPILIRSYQWNKLWKNESNIEFLKSEIIKNLEEELEKKSE